tara:strand:+ start:479 stop:904 length:426 start_codon:yes stop_codon:yes gene_type:complete
METKYFIPLFIHYPCYDINSIFDNFTLINKKYPVGCDEDYDEYFMGYIRTYIRLLATGGPREETRHIENEAPSEMMEVINYIKGVIKDLHKEADRALNNSLSSYKEALLSDDTKDIDSYMKEVVKNAEYKKGIPPLSTITG